MKLFVALFLILNTQLFADDSPELKSTRLSELSSRKIVIGKIIKTQGEATVINVKSRYPIKLKDNQEVLNDSSFHCKKGCYFTIKLNNKLSYIKVGQGTSFKLRKSQNDYIAILHSGFVKALFKSGEGAKSLQISTKNAMVTATNGKSLIIYNPLFTKTSVINFKGKTKVADSSGNENILQTLQYSSINKGDKMASEPEILDQKSLDRLLNAFNIDKKKLN